MTDVVRPGEKILYKRAVSVVQMLHKFLKDIVNVVIDVKVISLGGFHETVEHSIELGILYRVGSNPVLAFMFYRT